MTFSATPAEGGNEKQLDPLRLPADLRQWVGDRPNVQAAVKVRRIKDHNPNAIEEMTGLAWDAGWRDAEALPMGVTVALPISELGIAYQVKAQVAAVNAGSPGGAARAAGRGLHPWLELQDFPEESRSAAEVAGQADQPAAGRQPEQRPGAPLGLCVLRDAIAGIRPDPAARCATRTASTETIELDLQRDPTWPLFEPTEPRGLLLFPHQDRIVRADNLGEAVQMGMRYTYRTIARST